MLFNDFTSIGIVCADGAVIWTLWTGIAAQREAERAVGVRVDEKIFLFKSEPEIRIVVVDGRTAVGLVR